MRSAELKRIQEGIESIEIAFDLVEFSYRIQSLGIGGVQLLFHNEVQIKEGVIIKSKSLDEEGVGRFFLNHLNSVICSFWIAIDEAFEKALGKKNLRNKSELDDFRAVIYMFRCAFAHEISEPKWYVRDEAYLQRSYKLEVPPECACGEINEFEFDFKSLNGQNVTTAAFKHFPGLATLSAMACNFLRSSHS